MAEREQRRPFDGEALAALGRVHHVAASPCGTWVAVEVARPDADRGRYVADLWRVSATDPDAPPVRLTWGEHHDHAPRFRHDGALLFLSNRPVPGVDDEKRSQVWMLPAEGGEPRPLTDEPTGVSAFACGGDRLALVTLVWPGVPHAEQRKYHDDRKKNGPSALHYTRMPVRSWDHWVTMPAPHLIAYLDGERRDLTPDADREHRDAPWTMSADGRRLVISHDTETTDRLPESRLLVFDLDTSERRLLEARPRSMFEGLAASPDGRFVVGELHVRVTGQLGRPTLVGYDLDAGELRELAPEWDVHPKVWAVTADGQALVTAGVGAQTAAFAVGLADGAVTRITDPAVGGSHHGLAPTPDGELVGVRSRIIHPPEVFRSAIAHNARPRMLAPLSGFDPRDAEIIALDEFTVKSADGSPVHSLLVRPADATGETPALLWIHGGPVGQHEDGWHWRWNALVAVTAGYTVALPNPRGSTGYGQRFVEGVWNNEWGAACFDDVMAVTDHLAADPGVDADRIAAMGASFGGYMTNWIGARTDRFRCLVSHAGIYRMSTFHGTSDWPAWFLLQAGVPPEDPAFDRHSPHRFVADWRSPTLVVHGERDYRVPISQALLLFEDLQRHGVESELLVYPDENHWVLSPRNAAHWYGACLGFVGRYLMPEAAK